MTFKIPAKIPTQTKTIVYSQAQTLSKLPGLVSLYPIPLGSDDLPLETELKLNKKLAKKLAKSYKEALEGKTVSWEEAMRGLTP